MIEKQLKVLVVDDSAFMRLLISDLLSSDPGLDVIGTANNGLDATKMVVETSPDIVLLDMNMGEYDGLYAVKAIMEKKPTPILILSSVGNTDLQPIFEALKNGAVDYINKPNRNKSKMREIQFELIQKIKSVSRAKPRTVLPASAPRPVKVNVAKKRKSRYNIIAIGASTGGPTAIEQVISAFPANFDLPVIICQHMPSSFIPSFVQRLDAITPLHVTIATKDMVPEPGKIIFCPGHANLILRPQSNHGKIDFTNDKYPDYNNPSINAMMGSVASIYGDKTIGVILTGMGKDGVNGMLEIKKIGGFTIAQNKESSVIYGMPKVAVEKGAVSLSLDIKEIGNYLVNEL